MDSRIVILLVAFQAIYYVSANSLSQLCPPNQPNCQPTVICPPHQPNCNQPTTQCHPSLCLNGGSCNLASNTPGCACKAGFTGQRCETEYFRCVTNGRFKDQYGCHLGKYFECAFVRDTLRVDQSGVLTQRECPPGLLFNTACDSCDYASRVQC